MPVAECIRRCFDSKIDRRYWPGDQDEISFDHVFVRMKEPCFKFLNPDDEKKAQAIRDGIKVEDVTEPLPKVTSKQRGNPNWRKKSAEKSAEPTP